MNSDGYQYSLCGWRLHSEIRLPELPEWVGCVSTEEVEVLIGHVPTSLCDTALNTPYVEIETGGRRALMRAPNVGTYLIENGNRIVIDPAPGVASDSSDIRLFLLGAGLGYLCHQREVLPIHASAVEIEGRAVLFTGRSGAGKSTLADAFLRAGHRILTDDVAPIQLSGQAAKILPSIARIRLWPDSASHAGWPIDQLERCRATLLKVTRPVDFINMTDALEPVAVFHLQPSRTAIAGALSLTPIGGARALSALSTRVYRERGLIATVGKVAAIARIAAASSRIPHHFRMERRLDYASLPATVNGVLAALQALR